MKMSKKELEKYHKYQTSDIILAVHLCASKKHVYQSVCYHNTDDVLDEGFDSLPDFFANIADIGIWKVRVEQWINSGEEGDIDGLFYKLINSECLYHGNVYV